MYKNIFTYNIDIKKNAYLNWRIEPGNYGENQYVFADAYAIAAIELMDSILKNNSGSKADALIFPILFSINHSIEVYLKAIIWTIHQIQGTELPEKKLDHNIKDYFQTVKKLIISVDSAGDMFENSLTLLKEYIDELSALIAYTHNNKENLKIDFSRYPCDVKGNAHFYAEKYENVVIDIENLRIVFDKISRGLENIYFHCTEVLDNIYDD